MRRSRSRHDMTNGTRPTLVLASYLYHGSTIDYHFYFYFCSYSHNKDPDWWHHRPQCPAHTDYNQCQASTTLTMETSSTALMRAASAAGGIDVMMGPKKGEMVCQYGVRVRISRHFSACGKQTFFSSAGGGRKGKGRKHSGQDGYRQLHQGWQEGLLLDSSFFMPQPTIKSRSKKGFFVEGAIHQKSVDSVAAPRTKHHAPEVSGRAQPLLLAVTTC